MVGKWKTSITGYLNKVPCPFNLWALMAFSHLSSLKLSLPKVPYSKPPKPNLNDFISCSGRMVSIRYEPLKHVTPSSSSNLPELKSCRFIHFLTHWKSSLHLGSGSQSFWLPDSPHLVSPQLYWFSLYWNSIPSVRPTLTPYLKQQFCHLPHPSYPALHFPHGIFTFSIQLAYYLSSTLLAFC